MSEHCPKYNDVLEVMYEWPLDKFLMLRQVVQMKSAMKEAQEKDYKLKNPTNKP